MKIHEYQGKAVLAQYGVPVPKGKVAYTVDEAVEAAKGLGFPVVVKAQIHAGGRGKGGGVKLAKSLDGVRDDREGDAGHDPQDAPDGPGGPGGASPPDRAGDGPLRREGDVPGDPRRPGLREVGVHGLRPGRHGHRGGRGEGPGCDPEGDGGPRGRLPPLPGAQARLRPRPPAGRRQQDRPLHAVSLPGLRGHGRLARRDQPLPDHEGGRRPRPRRQDQLRRQRPLPPPRPRRAAGPRRGGEARGRGLQVQPELHQARGRHRRLHGERGGPRHGHHGHHQAGRGRARELPRRGRGGQRRPDQERLPDPARRPRRQGGAHQHLRRHPALRRAGRGRHRRRARPLGQGPRGRPHEGQQRGQGQGDARRSPASTSTPRTG